MSSVRAITVAELLETAKAQYPEGVRPDGHPWYAGLLKIEFGAIRKGATTSWASLMIFTGGKWVRLSVRVDKERTVGQIVPALEADLAELQASGKAPAKAVSKREAKAQVSFQRWNVPVKTAPDGITPLTDAEGQPILPPDENRSTYFRVVTLVNEFFVSEVGCRTELGAELIAKATEMRRAAKATPAAAILAAFNVGRARTACDMLLTNGSIAALRSLGLAPADIELLTKTAFVGDINVVELVQQYISGKSLKNAGAALPNPIARVTVAPFDRETGIVATGPKGPKVTFYDGNQPFVLNGAQRYEVLKVPGADTITNANVHKAFPSGSRVTGIIEIDSVCFSKMGISIPITFAGALVVESPAAQSSDGLDDLFDGEPLVGEVRGGPAPALARSTSVAAAADGLENFDGLLDELNN